jgi:hypothetical protein
MTGMTGSVPYYGGRFTPAQAYAATHPPRPSPAPPVPQPPSAQASQHPAEAGAGPERDPVAALQHLLDSGVLTQKEFDELLERVAR